LQWNTIMKIKFPLTIATATLLVVALDFCNLTGSVWAFNPEHLRRLIQSGECQDCDLSNADLSGQNLEGNDLTGAHLRGANLSGANLRQATLQRADLTGANLTGARLQQAILWRSILRDVDLRNANLQRARLLGNDLRGMNLQGINLEDASLEGVNLEGANLTGANLHRAILTSVNLRGANLTGADIRDTSATDVNIEGAIGLNPNGSSDPNNSTNNSNPPNNVDQQTQEASQLLASSRQLSQTRQFPESIQAATTALTIYRQILDRPGELTALATLAATNYEQRDYPQTVIYGNQALAIARNLEDQELEWQMLTLLGNAYYDQADYLKAVEIFRQTLTFRDHLGASAANSGRASLAVGDFSGAVQESEYAMTSGDPLTRTIAFNTLSATYRILGESAKTIDYAQQALEAAQATEEQKWVQEALLNLAEAYQLLGDASQAREYVAQSLRLAQQIGDRRAEAKAKKTQGNILQEQGDYPGAIAAYQESSDISRVVGDRRLQAEALQGLGTAQKNAGDASRAANSLKASLDLWTELRRVFIGNEYFQASFDELQSQTFRLLQEVYIDQNQPEAALEVAEQSRTRIFTQTAAAKLTITVTAPGIDRIKAMAKERNATLVMYSLRERCRDIFQFCGGINQRNQKYLQESQLYIWVVKPTGEIIFRAVDLSPLLKPRNITFDTLVVNSREGIGIRGLDNKSNQGAGLKEQNRPKNRQLQNMYQLLIAPIAEHLPQNEEEQVILIPQGSLFMIPFAALQDDEGTYLIEKHTLTLTPSLSVLEVTQQQRQTHGQFSLTNPRALVVGNPTMPRLQIYEQEEVLAPLPGAEIEARAIAPLLNTQPLIGDRATKESVLQQMPGAGIIHFATHGILDDAVDVYGVLAFAPDDPTVGSTGLLHAQEILDLNLQAQLVVLSACNTARGKISGDGVAGLARSFIAAGSPTVVASIWSVPDAPTAALMTNFYQNLAQKPNIAQALRQAMLTTMQEFPQPRDWAAFTSIGEAN
jgi:CHAT domain-containing protein/uncharacterized protein YjbI with pentapeptide repeats